MPNDDLTMTIRIWDPTEKTDGAKAARWVVIQVPREDRTLSLDAFIEKHVKPALPQVK